MATTQIVCANCGAKYRIPETFQGTQAKCKACGNVIDVASQQQAAADSDAPAEKPATARPAAAKAATARPAAAKPARARGEGRAKKEKDESSDEKSARGVRRAGRASAGGRSRSGGGRGRRGAEDGADEKKGNKGVLIGGGLLVVAIAVVAVIFMMNGDDPTTTDTANAGTQPANADANKGDDPKADEATASKGEGAPTDATGAAAKPPAEETADPDADSRSVDDPAEKPAEKTEEKPKPAPKKGLVNRELNSKEDVFNPKTETEPLDWPEYVTDEDKATVEEKLDAIRDGGITGIRAKTELENLGHKALVGIINRLREIDYLDSDSSAYAYDLNRLLEAMAIGVNAGYQPTEFGEDIPLATAHKNAITAKTWQRLLNLYPTEESFKKMRKTRRTRNK